ncbi:hypothetical protein [Candidatus Phytoplasma oryzae]|nr:hypothetical protein PIE28_02235 [Candidatus Phytoplasma oryzae]
MFLVKLYFLKKVLNYIFCIIKRKKKFIIIFLGILLLILCLSFNLKRDIYKKNPNHYWSKLKYELKYNNDYIRYKIPDIKEIDIDNEIKFIGLKSMFLGIIICVILLSLKKGLSVSISLGTFLGSCVGIWIFILFPSFIYLLELLFIYLLELKFYKYLFSNIFFTSFFYIFIGIIVYIFFRIKKF